MHGLSFFMASGINDMALHAWQFIDNWYSLSVRTVQRGVEIRIKRRFCQQAHDRIKYVHSFALCHTANNLVRSDASLPATS